MKPPEFQIKTYDEKVFPSETLDLQRVQELLLLNTGEQIGTLPELVTREIIYQGVTKGKGNQKFTYPSYPFPTYSHLLMNYPELMRNEDIVLFLDIFERTLSDLSSYQQNLISMIRQSIKDNCFQLGHLLQLLKLSNAERSSPPQNIKDFSYRLAPLEPLISDSINFQISRGILPDSRGINYSLESLILSEEEQFRQNLLLLQEKEKKHEEFNASEILNRRITLGWITPAQFFSEKFKGFKFNRNFTTYPASYPQSAFSIKYIDPYSDGKLRKLYVFDWTRLKDHAIETIDGSSIFEQSTHPELPSLQRYIWNLHKIGYIEPYTNSLWSPFGTLALPHPFDTSTRPYTRPEFPLNQNLLQYVFILNPIYNNLIEKQESL